MRTYTDEDGVFVHVDDLAASLRRVAEHTAGLKVDCAIAQAGAFTAVADGLDGLVKMAALEDAVRQTSQSRLVLGRLFGL